MATYSSLRLKMGKEEIFLSQFGYLDTEMFIEYSSTFHMTFVQIGEFDWLSGRQKGSIFVNRLKNFFSDKAKTYHICLGN